MLAKRPLQAGDLEAAPRPAAQAPNARSGPLDWREFSARSFPTRRRHDLEAIAAYGAYRSSQRTEDADKR